MESRNQQAYDAPFNVIESCSFDVIEMRGEESVDFLHRISTNDFSGFSLGTIRKTLLITDKGRIIDAVWVIHEAKRLLLVTSEGMAEGIIAWLNKYIIMEDIHLENVSDRLGVTMHFSHHQDNKGYRTDFFSHPVRFELTMKAAPPSEIERKKFEVWRIRQGIPATGREMVQDYNPLELHLWNWISFTKGCYIGQEVIARLETYNKIQRALYRFSSTHKLPVDEILCDSASGQEIGKITSIVNEDSGSYGLAIVRSKDATITLSVTTKSNSITLLLESLAHKGTYGRN